MIGIDPHPFAPIPKRQRHHKRYYRIEARILLEERALHLQTVTHDLERRARLRGTEMNGDDTIIQQHISGRSARAIAKAQATTVAEVNKALDPTIDDKLRKHTLALELVRLDEMQEVFCARALQGDVQCGPLITKPLHDARPIHAGNCNTAGYRRWWPINFRQITCWAQSISRTAVGLSKMVAHKFPSDNLLGAKVFQGLPSAKAAIVGPTRTSATTIAVRRITDILYIWNPS
jgi:hypothetical protein